MFKAMKGVDSICKQNFRKWIGTRYLSRSINHVVFQALVKSPGHSRPPFFSCALGCDCSLFSFRISWPSAPHASHRKRPSSASDHPLLALQATLRGLTILRRYALANRPDTVASFISMKMQHGYLPWNLNSGTLSKCSLDIERYIATSVYQKLVVLRVASVQNSTFHQRKR